MNPAVLSSPWNQNVHVSVQQYLTGRVKLQIDFFQKDKQSYYVASFLNKPNKNNKMNQTNMLQPKIWEWKTKRNLLEF